MIRCHLLCGLFILVPSTISLAAQATNEASLLDVRKIWDAAPHNAFTDLIRFNNRWFCTFREASNHVSPDGALRIISSRDGVEWKSAALVTAKDGDLRDAKLSITPKNKLMLNGAKALHQPAPFRHQSYVWLSDDGAHWGEPMVIGEPNMWLWRITWHKKRAYSVGYKTGGGNKFIRLYEGPNGNRFIPIADELADAGFPNESSLLFLKDDTALCIVRRDNQPSSALLGMARPPYKNWEWKDTGVKLGGPQLISLPDGRIVVGARLYDKSVRMSLLWLDPHKAELTEFLALPSKGDCSYPGLVWHDDLLWISYYSSHEGKTSIYLAKVKISVGKLTSPRK